MEAHCSRRGELPHCIYSFRGQTRHYDSYNFSRGRPARSAFAGYLKDRLTTLKETHDRLFGTLANASWQYAGVNLDANALRERAQTALLRAFASHDSLSVQQTLYAMAEATLEAVPEISEIHLFMPNKHCNLVDLSPFGQDNPNEIFVPTDEPHGSIEATVRRAE